MAGGGTAGESEGGDESAASKGGAGTRGLSAGGGVGGGGVNSASGPARGGGVVGGLGKVIERDLAQAGARGSCGTNCSRKPGAARGRDESDTRAWKSRDLVISRYRPGRGARRPRRLLPYRTLVCDCLGAAGRSRRAPEGDELDML